MKIKEIRESRGLTQRQAASNLGLSPVVYGRYENGIRKPDPETLMLIADYFGVTVDALLGHTETDTKKEPANGGQIDGDIETMIQQYKLLSPQERQRVLDFAAGILSSREP